MKDESGRVLTDGKENMTGPFASLPQREYFRVAFKQGITLWTACPRISFHCVYSHKHVSIYRYTAIMVEPALRLECVP
jgi:hypothetical protein